MQGQGGGVRGGGDQCFMIQFHIQIIKLDHIYLSLIGHIPFQVLSHLNVEYSSDSVARQKPHHSQSNSTEINGFYVFKMFTHRLSFIVVQPQSQQVNRHHEYLQQRRTGQLENSFTICVVPSVVIFHITSQNRWKGKSSSHCQDISREQEHKRTDRQRFNWLMRVQTPYEDAVLHQTGYCVCHKYRQQLLNWVGNGVCQVEVVCHIADSESWKIDEAHPPELEASHKFERLSDHSLQRISSCAPNARIFSIGELHDRLVDNSVERRHSKASADTSQSVCKDKSGPRLSFFNILPSC